MAYENMTYERILQRMIDRVQTQYPNIDMREGSIVFNALAPAALELAISYTELDNILNESFVQTASREYLMLACSQMGMDISVFDETLGVHKGVFNVEVPIGSRWSGKLYNYVVSEYIGLDENNNHEYRLTCETSGSAPNKVTGDLTAITYTANDLTVAQLTECLIEGEDETSDDDIRTAYYDHVNGTASDGNVKQYERWCSEYPGIGNYKIIPLPDDNITVRVYVLSASNGVASEELMQEFQTYLDPNSEGMGNGVAPIGASVEVSTATEHDITVTANIKMKQGYTDTSVIDTAIEQYFASIGFKSEVVPYMTLGAVILSVEGVESINNLKINDATNDVTLEYTEIPVLANSEWTVV